MKLNKIITLTAAGVLMCAASSCDDKWEPNTAEEGTVNLRSLSVDMSDAEKVTGSVISRATVDLSGYIPTNRVPRPTAHTPTATCPKSSLSPQAIIQQQ